MNVSIRQFQTGIVNYIEQEIASKAVGIKKFMVYFVIPNLYDKIPELLNKLKDNDMFKDYFVDDNMINIDQLYNSAKIAIRKTGQIEYSGILFNETDIDKLYSYIKNTEVS